MPAKTYILLRVYIETQSIRLLHRHQSLLHHRTSAALSIGRDMHHLRARNDQPLARLHHFTRCFKLTIIKRREKVDLVFHSRHLAVFMSNRQRRIAARDVCKSAHRPTMKAALLLSDALAVRQGECHFTWRDAHKLHAQMLHHALAG
jgi:hypothetical protein